MLDRLKIESAALVTHDIGNMVGYAFAAQFPARVKRWVVIDAPLPGIGPWDEQLRNPKVWHFNFRGPDVERLVKGRERIYLDRFWNELSANPKKIDEATRRHYARLYARPGAMHCAFEQFAAFTQDAIDNEVFAAKGKLIMPILALGGDHSYKTLMADIMRFVATDVDRRRHHGFRSLGDGGAAAADHGGHRRFHHQDMSLMKRISCGGKPRTCEVELAKLKMQQARRRQCHCLLFMLA